MFISQRKSPPGARAPAKEITVRRVPTPILGFSLHPASALPVAVSNCRESHAGCSSRTQHDGDVYQNNASLLLEEVHSCFICFRLQTYFHVHIQDTD